MYRLQAYASRAGAGSRLIVGLATGFALAMAFAACATSPPLGSVSGYAYACAGSAIGASEPVIVDAYSGSRLVGSSETDSSHSYKLQVPPGSYVIRVPANAPEGKPLAVDVEITSGTTSQANFANTCK
jgi:hypothetical protein